MSDPSNHFSYYGHGKLLFSGEYYILNGAMGLALPTRFGQSFSAESTPFRNHLLYWQSYDFQKTKWLNLQFDLVSLDCLNAETDQSRMLEIILQQTRKLNPSFLVQSQDVMVESFLEFPSEWGLGSSSTLIGFMGHWANVDPYQLLEKTFGGSGYDVACADADVPIVFTRDADQVKVEKVNFFPPFKESLFFVYLERKQNSRQAIRHFKDHVADQSHTSETISAITEQMIHAAELDEFEHLMERHEQLIAEGLQLTTVKQRLFSDYPYPIKSLGAWGGDFVLATNREGLASAKAYFESKNHPTILTYDEMIL